MKAIMLLYRGRTLTRLAHYTTFSNQERLNKKEKKNIEGEEKRTRKRSPIRRRVDTYKTSQANQVTRGFTRVSSDRQPRYYESSN